MYDVRHEYKYRATLDSCHSSYISLLSLIAGPSIRFPPPVNEVESSNETETYGISLGLYCKRVDIQTEVMFPYHIQNVRLKYANPFQTSLAIFIGTFNNCSILLNVQYSMLLHVIASYCI